jgi:hypothetical protein
VKDHSDNGWANPPAEPVDVYSDEQGHPAASQWVPTKANGGEVQIETICFILKKVFDCINDFSSCTTDLEDFVHPDDVVYDGNAQTIVHVGTGQPMIMTADDFRAWYV